MKQRTESFFVSVAVETHNERWFMRTMKMNALMSFIDKSFGDYDSV